MAATRIRMRHLRCFLAVARHGSVTRAADSLGTVQPSVSRSLRELEEELGAALFNRGAGGLRLNAVGQALYARVSNGIGQVDRALDAVRGGQSEQRVVAYILPNVVRMVMPGALRRFRDLCPDVDVRFLPATGGGLADYMRGGRVDFGFGRLLAARHMEGMNFDHLYSEPLVFFVRPDHPLAGRKGVIAADVDAFEVVLPIPGTIIRDELDRFIISQGMARFSNVTETLSFEFARNYIGISDAVVCQPLGGMRRELAQGRVVRLDFAEGALNGAVGITTPAGQMPSAPAALLIEKIREEVRALGLGEAHDITDPL